MASFNRRLRLHTKKLLVYTFIAILCLSVYKLYRHRDIQLSDDTFSNLSKCPACYGSSLCTYFKSGDIALLGYSWWSIDSLFNVKNVYHGVWWSRNRSVVLKKLGYDSELAQLDRRICDFVHLDGSCDVKENVLKLMKELGISSAKNEKDHGKISRLSWEKLNDKAKLLLADWNQCSGQNKV